MHKWKVGQKFRLKPSKYLDSSTLRNFTPGKIYRVGALYSYGDGHFPMIEAEDKICHTWHYHEKEYDQFLHYWEPVKQSRRTLPEWF